MKQLSLPPLFYDFYFYWYPEKVSFLQVNNYIFTINKTWVYFLRKKSKKCSSQCAVNCRICPALRAVNWFISYLSPLSEDFVRMFCIVREWSATMWFWYSSSQPESFTLIYSRPPPLVHRNVNSANCASVPYTNVSVNYSLIMSLWI